MFTITNHIIYDYLFSIAYMKIAVSKLLEVQAKRIHILAQGQFTTAQTVDANKNINRQLKKLENLNLLLLNKFELILYSLKIQEMKEETVRENELFHLNCQRNQIQQKPQPAEEPDHYRFKGRGEGNVSNPEDEYRNGLAVFQTYVSDVSQEKKSLFLSYSVMKGTKMLILLSSPQNIKTRFVINRKDKSVWVEGTGTVIIKERFKEEIREKGHYFLNIRTDDSGGDQSMQMYFEMEIETGGKQFLHKSGPIKSQSSRFSIEPEKKISDINN